MTDRQYVRIVSYHVVRLPSDRAGHTWTLCGRRVGDMTNGAELLDTLPSGASCESCARLATWQDERAAGERT